jgi:hypothetical protein
MEDVSYIIQGGNIVMVIDNRTITVNDSHRHYDAIVEALKSKEFHLIPELYDIGNQVREYAQGRVEVVDGEVRYNGETVHNTLTDRLLDMMDEGFDIEPLINFLQNLMQNPSKRAVDELYLFLETNKMPITPDGHFLAYKNVRGDYTDIHSGTFDNSVGQVNEVPRNTVDEDRDWTCSTGLHFCSLEYLKSFPGQHTMILKINPRDVVSIPSDYNNTKGRCCRYEVVGEHEGEDRYEREAYNTPVVNVGDGSHNVRRAVVAYSLDDGMIEREFDGVEHAATLTGVPESYINRVLRGDRQSTAGYGWAWADQYEEPVCDEADDWSL